MKKYTDIMVDMETLDTSSSAVILSIALVAFNRADDTPERIYYDRYDITPQIRRGRTQSRDTLRWWTQQDKTVREEAFGGVQDIYKTDIFRQIQQHITPDVLLWAKGPAMDIAILRDLIEPEDRFWHYRNERDVRTLLNLGVPVIKPSPEFPHNPVSDAIAQIKSVKYAHDQFKLT